MKKIIYIVFSLIVLLTLGVFSTKAVNYNAANGTATGGTTGASFFDWNNYVNGGSDDDETWYFNGEECVKGQPLYFATSDTYNSEAECEEDNKVSPQTYTNGNNDVATGWSDTLRGIDVYTPDVTDITRYDSDNIAVGNGFNFINGLDSFSTSELDGTTEYGLRFNNPAVLDVNGGNVTDGLSMFGTGIAHDSVITGITPLSVSGLNTSSTGYTTPSGFTGMLKGLISGIATDLGFKPTVYTLPTENNIWKFTDVGDGDNILTGTGDEKKDFVFTTFEGAYDATVNNGETLKVVWNAKDKFDTCTFSPANHSDLLKTNVGSSGDKTVKFTIVKGNIEKTATSKVTLFCYKGETKASESITVTIKRDPNAKPDSDAVDFTFSAEDTSLTLKEGKATANLEWTIGQGDFKSCSSDKLANVDGWPPSSIIENKSATATINKAGEYKFKITCTPNGTTLKDVSREVTINVEPEGATPTDDLTDTNKWSKAEKDFIDNNCGIELVNSPEIPGGLISDNGALNENTKTITASMKISCGDTRAKKEIVNGEVEMTPGFDARTAQYGLEIHMQNSKNHNRITKVCNFENMAEKIKEGQGNTYNITCDLVTKTALAEEIKVAISNDNTIQAFAYVDYKTNEITGTNYLGKEETVRLRITTDKLGVGTGTPPKTPPGEKALTVNLSANKTQAKCGEAVTLTATVENDGKSANCILTSTNDNTKKPDEAWNSNQVVNGKFEKKTPLTGSNDKDVIYTYDIQCFKDGADKTGVKATGVKVTVEKCTAKEGETSWGKICDSTKEKCSQGQIQWSKQVQLNFENNEYVVKNSSAFNFGVDFQCDTSPFQAGFARLTIEDKVIQDVRLNKGQQSRVFAIPNIWEKLSEKTQNNIINTFKNCNGCDSVTIAKEKIWVARWNTFDEKNTLKNPNIDCNYSGDHPPSDLTFVGHNLPKKQAPGGGEEEGEEKDGKVNEILALSIVGGNTVEPNQKTTYNLNVIAGKKLPENAKCGVLLKKDQVTIVDTLANTFETVKNELKNTGLTYPSTGEFWLQVRCEDNKVNKYYSNTVTIVVGNAGNKGKTIISMKNVPKCGSSGSYGWIAVANRKASVVWLDAIINNLLKSINRDKEANGFIETLQKQGFFVDSFHGSPMEMPFAPSTSGDNDRSIFLICDKGWVTNDTAWKKASGNNITVFYRDFTLLEGKTYNMDINVFNTIGASAEDIPENYGLVTFKCKNCTMNEIGKCSHITIKKPGASITGWILHRDGITLTEDFSILLPHDKSSIEAVTNNNTGKYEIVIKNCRPTNDGTDQISSHVSFTNSEWNIDTTGSDWTKGHLFIDFKIKEGQTTDLGTITFKK